MKKCGTTFKDTNKSAAPIRASFCPNKPKYVNISLKEGALFHNGVMVFKTFSSLAVVPISKLTAPTEVIQFLNTPKPGDIGLKEVAG